MELRHLSHDHYLIQVISRHTVTDQCDREVPEFKPAIDIKLGLSFSSSSSSSLSARKIMRYTQFNRKALNKNLDYELSDFAKLAILSLEPSTVLLHSTTSRRFHRSRPLQHCVNETQETGDDTPLSDILWPMIIVSGGMLRPVLLAISISGARSAFNFARLVTMTNMNPLTEVSWIHEAVPGSFVERSLHRDFLWSHRAAGQRKGQYCATLYIVFHTKSFPSWRRSLP